MAARSSGTSKGLIDSLTMLAATLVAIAHSRLDLLSTDLEEGWEHVSSVMVLAAAGLFCLAIGVVLVTILIVAAFWDTHRLLALGLAAGFFLVTAVAAWAMAMYRMKTKPRLFAASLSELFKDRQQLASRT